jgi:hypothetical protein
MTKYMKPLRLASLVVAAAGFFISKALEEQHLEEKIDEALAKRDAEEAAKNRLR